MNPLEESRRLVIKIGSALITGSGNGIDRALIGDWAGQIARLRQRGCQALIVSSGAIACGMQRLGWNRRPHKIQELQACAAIGQMGLAQIYQEAFRQHALHTAQILLTHDDLSDRKRYLNARSTLNTLLEWAWCPSSTRTTRW
jgi:glutamate 5-kinase